MLCYPTSCSISRLDPSLAPITSPPFIINFIFPVPDGYNKLIYYSLINTSVPGVDIC
jgi:hypothetical protein